MEKNRLLDQLRTLAEYAQKDRQVAISRAKELIHTYALASNADVKKAFRQIEHD